MGGRKEGKAGFRKEALEVQTSIMSVILSPIYPLLGWQGLLYLPGSHRDPSGV